MWLHFIALDGSGDLNVEPQILLKGGHSSKMVIYRNIPTPANGQQSKHEIELTEVSLIPSELNY